MATLSSAPVVLSPHADLKVRARRIGLLGFGQIGRAVAEAATAAGDRCEVALVRDASRDRGAGRTRIVEDPSEVLDADVDLIVEVLGGVEPARTLVVAALERGIPVVTANKSLVAEHGPALRALAASRGVAFGYEAAVVAGVPFVSALASRPRLASVAALTGILNGTSHFIATALERGGSFADALADAQARGFSEPDSHADVSGRDAAEKLTILLQLCGAGGARPADITKTGLDAIDAADFAAAACLGGVLKPVAHAVLGPEGGTWVGPALVDHAHALAGFRGVTNALVVTPVAGGSLLFAGPGAGPDVTAATILDDVSEICAECAWRNGTAANDAPAPVGVPTASWFIRVSGVDLAPAHLVEFLAGLHLPVIRLETGDFGLAVRTVKTPHAAAAAAADALRSIGAAVTLMPVIDGAGLR